MAVIAFNENERWFAAAVVFSWILEHAQERIRPESDLYRKIEHALAGYNCLDYKDLTVEECELLNGTIINIHADFQEGRIKAATAKGQTMVAGRFQELVDKINALEYKDF